jgi:hypothetical protein
MSYSEIFNRAWNDMKNNLAFIAGLSLVTMIATWGLSLVPVIGWFASGLISMGYIRCLNQLKNGKTISYGDFFWGFVDINRLIQILILNLIVWFLMVIGFIFLFIPGIWWMVATWLSGPLFVIKNQDSVEAIKGSLQITKDRWWYFFGLGCLVVLLNIGGAMCFLIGLLISVPMTALIAIEVVEHFYSHPMSSVAGAEPPPLA